MMKLLTRLFVVLAFLFFASFLVAQEQQRPARPAQPSTQTPVVQPTRIPNAPTLQPRATGTCAPGTHPSASLCWSWSQGTGDPATGFHVWRSMTAGTETNNPAIATLNSNTILSYLDNTVISGDTYFYVVTAYNPQG